jgi:hypothetical protein
MNEYNLEKRLRDVVDGRQPPAPASLHRFLRELPDSQASRHRGPIGRLRAAFDRVRWLVPSPTIPRRVQVGFGVAMAIVIGFAGASALLTLRQGPVGPAATQASQGPTPLQPPLRTLSTHVPPVRASLAQQMLISSGLPVVDSQTMALPTAAVSYSKGYMGVTGSPYGANGMVHSTDGLYWDWAPPTEVNPQASIVTSIATDNLGMILVGGGVQGANGTTDGRIWIYSDACSPCWQETSNESVFNGVPVRLVVHNTWQFLAFGWSDDGSLSDAYRRVSEWRSVDGRTWTPVTAPIKGSSASVVTTAVGFVLSGTPVDSGAIDEPPIWYSADGETWTRAKTSDGTAQSMGPLVTSTVTVKGHVFAVSPSSDGKSRMLVASPDGGRTWKTVTQDGSLPNAQSISHVASLSYGGSYEYLFATTEKVAGSPLFLSSNGGVTWERAEDVAAGGPRGTMLLEFANGYQTGAMKFLSFGEPGSGLGIWLTQLY